MTVTITGEKELDHVLSHMRKTAARRAVSTGMAKAAQPLAKELKKAIPSRMKEARKTVGWRRLKTKEAPGGGAKVGWKVGRTAKKAGNEKFKERSGRKGVGLGRGLQWVQKGTKDRQTGKKGGPVRFTGRFPKSAPTAGELAQRNKGQTRQILREWVWKGIKKEIAKGKAF